MSRIILTYNIIDTITNFEPYTGFVRIRMIDLMSQKDQENPWSDYDKFELLKSAINHNIENDIIIEGAVGSINSYKILKDKLNELNVIGNIEKVYIKQSHIYDSLTEEEKESIDTHSRWTGDYTEDILLRQKETNQELQTLKAYIEEDSVEVIWVE